MKKGKAGLLAADANIVLYIAEPALELDSHDYSSLAAWLSTSHVTLSRIGQRA